MKRLVEFSLDQGGSVLVEVDEPSAGPVMRGLGRDRADLVDKADTTFEDATAAVTPAAQSLIVRLRSIEDPPDEVGIEFGVQLRADRHFHCIGRGAGQLHGVNDLAAPRRRRRVRVPP